MSSNSRSKKVSDIEEAPKSRPDPVIHAMETFTLLHNKNKMLSIWPRTIPDVPSGYVLWLKLLAKNNRGTLTRPQSYRAEICILNFLSKSVC